MDLDSVFLFDLINDLSSRFFKLFKLLSYYLFLFKKFLSIFA